MRAPFSPRRFGIVSRFVPSSSKYALALLAFLASACTADFTPRSVLDDLRVIALVTSPIEAGPSDEVTIVPFTIPPPGGSITGEQWTFCPFSVGSTTAFACAVPQCEVALTPRPDRSVVLSPAALAGACLATLTTQGAIPSGVPAVLPDQLSTLIRYVVTSDSDQTREAVQRLTLYANADPPVRNHPPVITAVQIGGRDVLDGATAPTLAPRQGLEVRVLIDPSSFETYVDAAGAALKESVVVSYYSTAGRFDYDRANGPDARVSLNHDRIEASVNSADLWVVARDLRGGEAVAGPFNVPITH